MAHAWLASDVDQAEEAELRRLESGAGLPVAPPVDLTLDEKVGGVSPRSSAREEIDRPPQHGQAASQHAVDRSDALNVDAAASCMGPSASEGASSRGHDGKVAYLPRVAVEPCTGIALASRHVSEGKLQQLLETKCSRLLRLPDLAMHVTSGSTSWATIGIVAKIEFTTSQKGVASAKRASNLPPLQPAPLGFSALRALRENLSRTGGACPCGL